MGGDCERENGGSSFEAGLLLLRAMCSMNRQPFHATLELTPLCNFRCPMCYVHIGRAEMERRGGALTAAQWLEITGQLANMGMVSVNLSGGEPFLRPDFREIYEGICRQGIFPSIFTNGALLDEEKIGWLREYPPHGVKVSLYGGCNETYATMCGDPHGFDKVSRAIDLLLEAGIPLRISTLLTEQNRQDLDLMREFCVSRRQVLLTTSELNESQRGAESDMEAARMEENIESWTAEQVKHAIIKRKEKPFGHCGVFTHTLHITWQGHAQSCGFLNREYIQLTPPYDMEAVWKQLQDKGDALGYPPECKDCPHVRFCKICPGTLAGASGYADRTTKDICKRAARIHARYEVLREQGELSDEADPV